MKPGWYKCFYCGKYSPTNLGRLLRKKYGRATIDHFYPKSKGGLNLIENRIIACQKCNLKKADKLPTQQEFKRFMEERKSNYHQVPKTTEQILENNFLTLKEQE